jgi:acyl-CoA thioester hydrolase
VTVEHRVPVRWQDIDGLGHVHHAAVLFLLEEGRDVFLASCGIRRDGYVIGRAEINYVREIRLEQGQVGTRCEVTRLGRSSLTTREQLLDDDGEAFVEATFGLVLWDPQRRASRPITPDERTALAPTEEATR